MDLSTAIPPDENRGPTLLAIIWISNGLSVFFVSCRIYTRVRLTRSFWIDDLVILLSLAISLIAACVETASIASGMGRHEIYLEPANLSQALKTNLIARPFMIMGFALPKISVALLLIRLMGPARHGFRFLVFIISTMTILATLNSIFEFAHCTPIDSNWKPRKDVLVRCWPADRFVAFNVAIASYSGVVDLCLALFPITVFWKLQLKLQKKIAICCIMGLGIFAAATCFAKVTTLVGLGATDITWTTVDLFIWTSVEICVIIICACIPTLGPLVRGKRKSTSERVDAGPYVVVDKQGAESLSKKGSEAPLVMELNSITRG